MTLLSTLSEIISGDRSGIDVEIADVVDDNRSPRIGAGGCLFVARPSRTNGFVAEESVCYAQSAVAAGAVALLAPAEFPTTEVDVPAILVPDVDQSIGLVAASVHSNPSSELPVVMVTGTDGKTTTSYMISEALRTATGGTVGLLSTIDRMVGGQAEASTLTTPEAPDIQWALRSMLSRGDVAGVMEASSIGLLQGRLRGVEGSVGVFTNLSPEHLDDHQTMENYFQAKELLVSDRYIEKLVFNLDDEYGRMIAATAKNVGIKTISTSVLGRHDADILLADRIDQETSSIVVRGIEYQLCLKMIGLHNIANALCALATATELGASIDDCLTGLGQLPGVPGRLERVDRPEHPIGSAYVDYAHTPAALGVAMNACKEVASMLGGRIIVVAGCGGDRDPSKRPEMGRTISETADFAVFTSDNPRSEDPGSILREMQSGVSPDDRHKVHLQVDRALAIREALSTAEERDVVLVAGKGHETYQQVTATRTIPFDDREHLLSGLDSSLEVTSDVS